MNNLISNHIRHISSYKTYVLLICLIWFNISCQNEEKVDKNALLIGNWQAVQLVENDTVLGINLDAVRLQFYPAQQYTFHGTLKEEEAGTYRVQKDLLFTNDTLVQPAHEKVVKILKLSLDSLQIEMLDKDRKRILDLKKMN